MKLKDLMEKTYSTFSCLRTDSYIFLKMYLSSLWYNCDSTMVLLFHKNVYICIFTLFFPWDNWLKNLNTFILKENFVALL